VLHDIGELTHLADYQQALSIAFDTLLKINISWQTWYPACSSTSWQLEGAIRTLQADGKVVLPGPEPEPTADAAGGALGLLAAMVLAARAVRRG
jgi:hypothetical protein